MTAFEWPRMLLNDLPTSFLLEVVVRVLFAYVTVFLFIKASGRRGIRQLSVFELVVILMLGSAAGDVTMYDDVPLLPVAMVFLALMVAYRLTTYFLCRSATFSVWIEGAPITLVRDGKYEISRSPARSVRVWKRRPCKHLNSYRMLARECLTAPTCRCRL